MTLFDEARLQIRSAQLAGSTPRKWAVTSMAWQDIRNSLRREERAKAKVSETTLFGLPIEIIAGLGTKIRLKVEGVSSTL